MSAAVGLRVVLVAVPLTVALMLSRVLLVVRAFQVVFLVAVPVGTTAAASALFYILYNKFGSG